MKTLLILVASLLSLSASGQLVGSKKYHIDLDTVDLKYIMMTAKVNPLMTHISCEVYLDIGKYNKAKHDIIVRNSDKTPLYFNGPIHALNYMNEHGWILMGQSFTPERQFNYYRYQLERKTK